jgi:hypothetical protein
MWPAHTNDNDDMAGPKATTTMPVTQTAWPAHDNGDGDGDVHDAASPRRRRGQQGPSQPTTRTAMPTMMLAMCKGDDNDASDADGMAGARQR